MRFSLSVKVSLALVALVVIGGSVTGFLVDRSSRGALQKSISTNQMEIAEQTLDKIDRSLYERLVSMQSVAGRQQIQEFLSVPAEQRNPATTALLTRQMDDIKIISGTWSELTIVDLRGNLALPSQDQNLEAEFAKQPSILKLFAAAAAGQNGYSDAIVVKNHAPVMLFMVPVHNQQALDQPIVGVMVGELAWPSVLEIIQNLDGATTTLINSHGVELGNNLSYSGHTTVANQSQALLLSKQNSQQGTIVQNGLYDNKNPYVTSYVKEVGFLGYKGNDWTLVLETPEALAFSSAQKLAKNLILIYVLILFVSVGLLLLALNKLVLRPIVNLSSVIERLSKGDFSLRTNIKSRDELGALGTGLNNMADKIRLAYANLEKTTEEARGEKSILETLLNNLPVGVLVVKAPSGEPIMMNHAGEQISGRGANTNISWSEYSQAYQVLNEDGTPYPTEELPLTITLKTGRTAMKDDMVMQRPDGTSVAVRAITTPIKAVDGSIERAVSVFEDISTERELERSRDEFFSIASHELRTPLTAIMGNSSLIQQYYNDKLPDDDVREMVSDIHESSLRLIEIVNDFLDTSRLEQKHMKYEMVTFNVVDVAKSVVKEYQVTGSRKKVHLEVLEPQSPLALVKADQNRSKQVLINLVGNAMKFTDSGTVTISFKPELKFIKVLIKDSGQGMSIEAQKLLFHKFEQTSSTVLTRDSVRGTGLGLYISKLIIEQMGGSIHLVTSKPGVGTTFSFSLPIASDNKETTSKDKA